MSNFLSHIPVRLFQYVGLYLTLPLTKAEHLLKSCRIVANSFGGAKGRAERNFVSSVLLVCTVWGKREEVRQNIGDELPMW